MHQGERAAPAKSTARILDRAERYRKAGRLQEANAQYRRLLDASPGDPAAHYGIGVVAEHQGDHGAAIPHFVAALRAAPEHPRHWIALATSLFASDRVAEARAILEKFRARGFPADQAETFLRPVVSTLFETASRLNGDGESERAEALLDALIALDDAHVPAIRLAALIAGTRGEDARAVDLLTIAVYRDPTDAAAFRDLGAAFHRSKNLDAAIGALHKAVELDPGMLPARCDLGDRLIEAGRIQEALGQFEAILAAEPGRAIAHNNLAFVQMLLGQPEEAFESYGRAVALAPDDAFLRSNRLLLALYMQSMPAAAYIAEARDYGERAERGRVRSAPHGNSRDPDRRLRVGFVSSDLRSHVVACFLEPFLEHLDRSSFEPVAYSAGKVADGVTERLRRLFALWRDVSSLDMDATAALIEADGIDILVDLSGHSAGNRLPAFARRPAPVQVTWIGYPGSTGLTSMDYRLTDHAFEPEGMTDAFHTETLWRLPGVTMTYRPEDALPEPAARPPCEANGYVTLGCLNRLAKVGGDVLSAWARILAALPEARLLLVAVDAHDPRARARLDGRLAEAGLPLDRVILEPFGTTTAYFALYNRIDLALDPFPHNGGVTTYDTLLMGVPLVTLRGERTPGRLGAAILDPMGMDDCITDSMDDYVARVVALASDRQALTRLRAGLADRMRQGPHTDHARHAAEVGTAFREMWQCWLAARE